ncbi:MAG: DEAD/DEAH box helicase [Alphaproteobacteria bacterium]
MTFKDLGLNSEILKALDECGYQEPTPIQAQAIPSILMMRDVVGLAQTGTGKTAGFTLPMIEILAGGRAKARMPRSLILSPTRELAAQIADNFDQYGKYCDLSKALLVGGTSMGDQIKILERGVDVLIATPGRLLDLFERGNILLTDIKIFVIDEADKMMDMGFIPDITKIAGLLPPLRQTLLFSATMPPEIEKLAAKFLSNPKEISVSAKSETAKTVKQFIVHVDGRKKKEALHKIIQREDVDNAFVFCNRKKDIDGLASWLKSKNYKVAALHGDMKQSERTATLEKFKSGEIKLLICSDVAARGIDVQNVGHVFNFDVPMNSDDYVHRIGRTGRAGKEGRTWMIATSRDEKFVDAIFKQDKNHSIEKIDLYAKSAEEKQPPSNKSTENVQSSEKIQKPQSSKGRNDNQKNSRRSRQDDDDSITGFGDDMPAFFSNSSN